VRGIVAPQRGIAPREPGGERRGLERAQPRVDGGLRELARLRNQPAAEVLARTRPLDLFRVGATLDPELRARRMPSAAVEDD